MAGWSSNSKYAFLGALRSAAQMVSYEVSIGFVIVSVLLCAGSLNLSADRRGAAARSGTAFRSSRCSSCSSSRAWPRPTARRSICPRANRSWSPGFFVEYSSMTFALFYLGEYANMILMSAMTTILFLGGWLAPFNIQPFTGALVSHLVADRSLVRAQDRVRAVLLPVGAGDLAALPLRPAHAARLEGVSAAVARLARADRGRAGSSTGWMPAARRRADGVHSTAARAWCSSPRWSRGCGSPCATCSRSR